MPKKKPLPRPKLFFPILALSIIFNLFFLVNKYLPPITSNQEDTTISGNVNRIVDGDTFDLADDQRIRLAGADTPEYPKGCLAHEARNRLQELILGKTVTLELIKADSFNRQVSYVFLNDLLIDKIMVEEGLAHAATNNPQYDPEILSSQDKAEELKKGIWSAKCQPKSECLIKGNYRRDKDTKIYHTPDCYNYPKIVINEEKDDSWFCTEEEAQEAGFVKSQDCPE